LLEELIVKCNDRKWLFIKVNKVFYFIICIQLTELANYFLFYFLLISSMLLFYVLIPLVTNFLTKHDDPRIKIHSENSVAFHRNSEIN